MRCSSDRRGRRRRCASPAVRRDRGACHRIAGPTTTHVELVPSAGLTKVYVSYANVTDLHTVPVALCSTFPRFSTRCAATLGTQCSRSCSRCGHYFGPDLHERLALEAVERHGSMGTRVIKQLGLGEA